MAVRLVVAEAGDEISDGELVADSTAMLNMICLQFGGEDLRTVGEVSLYAFPRADDAVQAASEMQGEMASQQEVTGRKLDLRIGLDSGDVERSGGTWIGQPLLRSTRLAALAPPGGILAASGLRSYLNRDARKRLVPFTGSKEDMQRLGTQAYELPWGSPDKPHPAAPPPRRERGDDGVKRETSTMPLSRSKRVFTPSALDVDAARTQLPLPPGMSERDTAHPEPEPPPEPLLRPVEPRLCLIRGRRLIVVDVRSPHATIGRSDENDLQIDIETASRRHADISYSGGRFLLTDHSWNGTYVYDADGKGQLVHNDHLELPEEGYVCPGTPKVNEETSFRFRRADAAATSA
jgi:hypothetical protein